jgi:hypothetical protein
MASQIPPGRTAKLSTFGLSWGKMKAAVAKQSRQELADASKGVPLTLHKTRPRHEFGH